MNGRGYHPRYRQGRRRVSVLPVIILIVALLAVLFLIFILIGNGLNKKTQGNITDTSVTQSQKEPVKAAPASVGCFFLDIEGEASSQTSNNIAKLSSDGALALSVEVKAADNTLLYSSGVARAFGKQSGSTLDIATLVSRAKARGLYVSAYYTLEFMKEKNADVKAAKLGYEAALISELCSYGVDDVMVYAPDASYENYYELLRLAQSVKATNKNAKIGVSVKQELYSHQNAAVIIDALFKEFDIIGIDLSDIDKKDIDKQVEKVLSNSLYYVLRYNARVVLPSVEDAALSKKLSDILLASNAHNYQYVK